MVDDLGVPERGVLSVPDEVWEMAVQRARVIDPLAGTDVVGGPAVEAAAAELEPHVRLLKVNTEEEQALGAAHAIRSIPTLILFAGGKEVRRMSGALDARGLVQWARG